MLATSKTVARKKTCPSHSAAGHHADHTEELPRLKRIRGQVDGVERMILEKRYCLDILMQIKAARSALVALEGEVLRVHLEGCVQDALNSKNSFQAGKKIKELVELLAR